MIDESVGRSNLYLGLQCINYIFRRFISGKELVNEKQLRSPYTDSYYAAREWENDTVRVSAQDNPRNYNLDPVSRLDSITEYETTYVNKP